MDRSASPRPGEIPAMVARGVATYRRNLVPGSLMALTVLAVYGASRLLSAQALLAERVLVAVGIELVGLVTATVIALPWFRLMLHAEEGTARRWRSALNVGRAGSGTVLTAGFFFWAGMLLGLRYLYGIPAVLVLIWYGLFGFVVADGETSGMRALGISIRLGQGRRMIVLLVGVVLALLNLVGVFPLGLDQSILGLAGAAVGLTVTTNVSLGVGADLYRRLQATQLPATGKVG